MKSKNLYQQLEKDFIKQGLSDDWIIPEEMNSFVTENFKRRSMGLLCDFTQEINKVYTAVFPSENVIQKILDEKVENAMLFLHHPLNWDITTPSEIFHSINIEQLKQLKERKISIYNLHVPLDNFSEYSTSVTLAKNLDTKIQGKFVPYYGALCGVFGETIYSTVQDLQSKMSEAIGHEAKLYNYGNDKITNHTIAVVAGGGNEIDYIKEAIEQGINTFVTGITAVNDYSRKTHKFAQKHKINIIGGTHYSTEKFACMAMIDYFLKQGLESEFIEGEPLMEDM